jgi:hypothetical protein
MQIGMHFKKQAFTVNNIGHKSASQTNVWSLEFRSGNCQGWRYPESEPGRAFEKL